MQLDGLERNDGIIAIATTNKLKMLDPAIQGRPNRFDVVIRDRPIRLHARKAILEKQVWGLASDSVITDAAESTEDLSGAQVKETAIHACQLAIRANLEPGQLSVDHFASAVKQLYRIDCRRPVGFSDSLNCDSLTQTNT